MRRAIQIASDRGNALVLAVLILLALTSVGVVSIHRTNMDLQVTGNVVRSMQAQIAGEAGADHGLGLVGSIPDQTQRQMSRDRDLALGHTGITSGPLDRPNLTMTREQLAFSSAVPDPAGADVTQHLPVVSGANSLARTRQDVAYRMSVTYLGKTEAEQGWGIGEVCHFIYDFNSKGGIPSAQEPVDISLPPDLANSCPDTVIIRARARAAAGPVPCQ